VNCMGVRDLLPEHALGVAGSAETSTVDRHLATCAACRKEARDLERAAATMAFSLASVEPPPDLADRVVGRLHAVAGTPAPGTAQRRIPSRRRARRTTALVLAASLSIGGLGWVATAARAPRDDQAASIGRQGEGALDALRRLIRKSEFADPGTEVRLGLLTAANGAIATGSAITIIAPSQDDRVLVLMSGLAGGTRHLPYRVTLVGDRNEHAFIGLVDVLDTSGGATVARIFRRDLSLFSDIVVRDHRGRIVLRGTLETGAPVASPGP
jgi:anti-sigma factor RsiW